jgi:hypothetical protein
MIPLTRAVKDDVDTSAPSRHLPCQLNCIIDVGKPQVQTPRQLA